MIIIYEKLYKVEIIDKIKFLFTERQKGAILRSRCKILVENENPSSSFLKIETFNAKTLKLKVF